MFFLARHLLGEGEGRDAGAVLAGFIFAFNPWHVAQAMHHAHVSGIEFLPLFVLFYLQAQEQRSTRLLAAACVMAALSALSCWYFFSTCSISWRSSFCIRASRRAMVIGLDIARAHPVPAAQRFFCCRPGCCT